jgi:hypothetical protein
MEKNTFFVKVNLLEPSYKASLLQHDSFFKAAVNLCPEKLKSKSEILNEIIEKSIETDMSYDLNILNTLKEQTKQSFNNTLKDMNHRLDGNKQQCSELNNQSNLQETENVVQNTLDTVERVLHVKSEMLKAAAENSDYLNLLCQSQIVDGGSL